MKTCISTALCIGGTLWAACASGQSVSNPTDPAVRVPPVRYQSVFAGFDSYREAKVASWREVNDEVARVGGHMGVLRANRATAAPTAVPKSLPTGSRGAK